jgi:glucose/arabinose dehydrogenase
MRTAVRLVCLTLVPVLAVLATGAVTAQRGAPAGPLPLDKLTLPPGFKISVFAEGVRSARAMAVGAKGTIFVGSMSARQVYALVDANHDGTADSVRVIATGLFQPTGLAFRDGALYIAAATKVVRLDDIENKLDTPPDPVTIVDGLPSRGHTWKFLAFGPDGLMYVSDGSPCNICEDEILAEPRYATILRMKPDGSSPEIFAHGVRNSVGFDWDPVTHNMWFTDNGRDDLGDDLPSDELNVATAPGQHFGYPYCHQGDTPDPTFGAKRPCSEFVPPAQKLDAHVAAIGMRFYTGRMFPAEYRNAIFIAQHGSWNRSQPAGYRVMVATVSGTKVTSYKPFVTGWLQGIRASAGNRTTGDAFARPADVQPLPDGSLLVSDDQGGRIYRVTYGR